MATLVLTRLWVNLLSSGEGISAPSLGVESSSGIEGGVRTYAGGRIRYVGREGVGGQLQRTLRLCTQATAEKLESWVGQTVLVRDVRGQHWWGVFSEVTRRAIKGATTYDLAITVDLVTQSEDV